MYNVNIVNSIVCISLQVGLWENRDQGVENILTSDSNAQFYTIIICLSPLAYLLPKILKLFGFPIFRHWAIWWKLFQKCIVRIKLDIYVFIATFKACIAYLKPNSPSLIYWHFCRLRKNIGPSIMLSIENELIVLLVRLTFGLLLEDI